MAGEDAVISDSLNHASIIDGIRLCKAERHRYDHLNLTQLEERLQQTQASEREAAKCASGNASRGAQNSVARLSPGGGL